MKTAPEDTPGNLYSLVIFFKDNSKVIFVADRARGRLRYRLDYLHYVSFKTPFGLILTNSSAVELHERAKTRCVTVVGLLIGLILQRLSWWGPALGNLSLVTTTTRQGIIVAVDKLLTSAAVQSTVGAALSLAPTRIYYVSF